MGRCAPGGSDPNPRATHALRQATRQLEQQPSCQHGLARTEPHPWGSRHGNATARRKHDAASGPTGSVFDRRQHQSLRWCRRRSEPTVSGGEQPIERGRRSSTLRNLDKGAHDVAYHVLQERGGLDRVHDQPVVGRDATHEHLTHGRRWWAGIGPSKRLEVVTPDQSRRRVRHGRDVQGLRNVPRDPTHQRRSHRTVPHAIHIPATTCMPPWIERVVDHFDVSDRDIARKNTVHAPPKALEIRRNGRHDARGNLTDRMDPSVGSPSPTNPHGLAQHDAQGPLDL